MWDLIEFTKVHVEVETSSLSLLLCLICLLQVTRVGWVPTKTDCDESGVQGSDRTCRQFYRVMEGCVPMYANLEIGLGLELVTQVQDSDEAAATCSAVQEGERTRSTSTNALLVRF